MTPNIAKNSIHTLSISALNDQAQDWERWSIPVIVEQTLPGETAEVKIIKVAKTCLVGKLRSKACTGAGTGTAILPGLQSLRRLPLQHLSYPAQLEFKTNIVREQSAESGRAAAPSVFMQ